MDERSFKRALVGIGRRFGASPKAREVMRNVDAEALWHGQCRHCGTKVKGHLGAIAHKCKTVAPEQMELDL